jgi:hypothetical protein
MFKGGNSNNTMVTPDKNRPNSARKHDLSHRTLGGNHSTVVDDNSSVLSGDAALNTQFPSL